MELDDRKPAQLQNNSGHHHRPLGDGGDDAGQRDHRDDEGASVARPRHPRRRGRDEGRHERDQDDPLHPRPGSGARAATRSRPAAPASSRSPARSRRCAPSASDAAMPIGDSSRYRNSATRRRPCGPRVASSITSRRQPPARALSVAAISQYPRSPARSQLPRGQAIIGTCTSITGSMRSKMSSRLVPVTVMPWFLSPTTACDGSCSSRMMSATATASSAVPQG